MQITSNSVLVQGKKIERDVVKVQRKELQLLLDAVKEAIQKLRIKRKPEFFPIVRTTNYFQDCVLKKRKSVLFGSHCMNCDFILGAASEAQRL